MRHPTEGVLRRLIDEPAGVADCDRQHLAGCSTCLADVAALRSDAALVGAALAADSDVDVDVDAAWRRLSSAVTPVVRDRGAAPSPASRFRDFLRRPVAAALAVALVVTGATAAAAGDWLQIFRTDKLAPVALTAADLLALPDLSSYGELAFSGDPDVREVPDAATAADETGLQVPEVAELPRAIVGEPVYQVGDRVTATFTFSAARAAQAAAEAGESLPAPPPGLDGSAVRLVAGPGVAQVWASAAGAPALIVGRAVAPTAYSSGVPFDTARDYLLSLPGLPDDVAAQLRAFAADGSTLPLPVPADQVTTRPDEVNDVPATVLVTRNRALAAVVWVDDGTLTFVAGSLDDDEVLAVARGLR